MLVREWPEPNKWPNFKASEMECRCGCGMLPDPKLMEWLQWVRNSLRQPMPVTSGARCPEWNAKIGGRPGSQHVHGMAADIAVHGLAAMNLIGVAKLWGVQGLGLKQHGPVEGRFVHLDTGPRSTPTLWTYP